MRVPAELEWRPGTRRLVWTAIALGASALLVVARQLHPDRRGFGTHTQLGLPPCAFHSWTGLPCPTCGLTTSFAYMARWQITSAFAAHPLGPLLFALTLFALLCAAHGVVRASPASATLERLRIRGLAVIIAIATAACWLVRLAVLLST
jgi:hypothetical protein